LGKTTTARIAVIITMATISMRVKPPAEGAGMRRLLFTSRRGRGDTEKFFIHPAEGAEALRVFLFKLAEGAERQRFFLFSRRAR